VTGSAGPERNGMPYRSPGPGCTVVPYGSAGPAAAPTLAPAPAHVEEYDSSTTAKVTYQQWHEHDDDDLCDASESRPAQVPAPARRVSDGRAMQREHTAKIQRAKMDVEQEAAKSSSHRFMEAIGAPAPESRQHRKLKSIPCAEVQLQPIIEDRRYGPPLCPTCGQALDGQPHGEKCVAERLSGTAPPLNIDRADDLLDVLESYGVQNLGR
jgi:hypothetical protein